MEKINFIVDPTAGGFSVSTNMPSAEIFFVNDMR
jgi:hypothetical protein